MKLFLAFLLIYGYFLLVDCSDFYKSSIQFIMDRRSIWWRFNSVYNEAYLKILKKKFETVKRLKERLEKRRNEILIEKLRNQAKSAIVNQSLVNIQVK